jgi:cytochrome c556
LPARHAVHTEQLQKVMSDLGATVASNWPQEIQQDVKEERSVDYQRAEELARLLARTTRILPEAVKDSPMSSADREVFMANVDLLAFQAIQLEASAREHRIREMRGILNQIQTTCYGCHSQFRGEPGPLKFGN